MDWKDIEKSLKEAGVDAAVITAAKALDNSSEVERLTKVASDAEGKAAGILEDKKRYKTERDEARGKLTKIETDKLPTEQQHIKALEKIQKELADEKAGREADATKTAKANREVWLSDQNSGIGWKPDFSASGKILLTNAMTGVDQSDKSAVEAVMKAFTESHKGLIVASAPQGSEHKSGGTPPPPSGEAKTCADSVGAAWKTK